jgi:YD repeat-containing protein
MKVNVTLEADGITANFPVTAGPGGSIRSGWFSDLTTYDFLDNPVTVDRDATGSTPARLVTTYQYDRNENRTKETRPEGNTIEWDYDERNLVVATLRGANDSALSALSAVLYDKNGNQVQVIDPADTDSSTSNNASVTLANAFGLGSPLAHRRLGGRKCVRWLRPPHKDNRRGRWHRGKLLRSAGQSHPPRNARHHRRRHPRPLTHGDTTERQSFRRHRVPWGRRRWSVAA